MYKDLSPGIKISISRSISTAFEQYMAKINWDESKFNLQDLVDTWKTYIIASSAWYAQIDDSLKDNEEFHEELAAKINEVVEKLFSEKPTDGQIKALNELEKHLNKELVYSCKLEAKYLLEQHKA
jgi:hypothetical protein